MEKFQGIYLNIDYVSLLSNGIYQFSILELYEENGVSDQLVCYIQSDDGEYYYEYGWEIYNGIDMLMMHNFFKRYRFKLKE